jgi:SagB-type dehydrogenase family enzyme
VPARFVRSPHVVCYWSADGLVLYNYAVGTKLYGNHLHARIVDACTWPRSAEELAATCGADRSALAFALRELRKRRLLYSEQASMPHAERAMLAFQRWNPAAGFFHMASRNVRFGPRADGARKQRNRAKSWPMPPPVKRYPGRPVVRLPHPEHGSSFADVLLKRRTWRRFSRDPIALDHLALLLRYTAGIHHWIEAKGLGRQALRTSPSGGARHAIEVYVAALDVTGIAPGLYHYAADRHALERVRNGVTIDHVRRYLPAQPWFEVAPLLVFFSALFERALWRYDYCRAYRAMLIEAGHLCQTFCLTATWLGLAPFCSMALGDDAIDGDIGLDGISESVLYAAGVGMRERDALSGIAPRDVAEPTLITNPAFTGRNRRVREGAR